MGTPSGQDLRPEKLRNFQEGKRPLPAQPPGKSASKNSGGTAHAPGASSTIGEEWPHHVQGQHSQEQHPRPVQPDPTRAPLSINAAETSLKYSQARLWADPHSPGHWPQASISLQPQQTNMQRNWLNWYQRPKPAPCARVFSAWGDRGTGAQVGIPRQMGRAGHLGSSRC